MKKKKKKKNKVNFLKLDMFITFHYDWISILDKNDSQKSQ